MLLAIEELTREEIRALDLQQQAQHLSDVLYAVSALGRDLVSATTTLATLRARYALDRDDETKSNAILAAGALDALKIRARTLREIKSALQTLMRSAMETGG